MRLHYGEDGRAESVGFPDIGQCAQRHAFKRKPERGQIRHLPPVAVSAKQQHQSPGLPEGLRDSEPLLQVYIVNPATSVCIVRT